MVPNHVRFGDRYVIETALIKYFYIDTDKNTLFVKLKDGETLSLTYGESTKAYACCLRNYVYLLDILGIDYPYWLNEKELSKLNSIDDDDEEE